MTKTREHFHKSRSHQRFQASRRPHNLKRVTQPKIQTFASASAVTTCDTTARTSLATYDELNRLTRSAGPAVVDSAPLSPTYNQTIRPVTRYTYNALGQLTQVSAGRTDAGGLTPANNDVASVQATYTYDDYGRRLTQSDQLGRTWTYRYDRHGNLTQSTDARGQVLYFTWFSGYGRQLKCITKDTAPAGHPALDSACATGPTALKYVSRNALGLITSAGSPEVLYTYAYTPSKRVASVTDNRGPTATKTLAYTWSGGGRLNKMVDGEGGETNYLYDAVGRLSGIWGPGSVPGASGDYVRFEWDPAGRLTQKQFSNGVRTYYTSHSDGSLAQVQSVSNANFQMSQFQYGYDGFGARTTRQDQIGTYVTQWRFDYDGLNRLTGEYVSHNLPGFYNAGGAQYPFARNSYDIYGNLARRINTPWQAANNGGATITSNYTSTSGGAHQMTQRQNTIATIAGATLATASAVYGYDLNGNRTSRTDNGTSVVETYTYDALNRMSSSTGAAGTGSTIGYGYDDQGRRVRKGALAYLYDGQDIYATYSGAAWGQPAQRTLHGPGVDDPLMTQAGTAKSFLHADGQGSVGVASDTSGNTAWFSFYDAWGGTGPSAAAAGATIPSQQYTGRENDGGGLYYYRARYYDPDNARFTQRDPIGLASGQVNPYAYVGNDPVNFTDPSGMLLYPWHVALSFQGMRNAGFGIVDSASRGFGAANVDFRSGSQGTDAASTAMHAMGGLVPGTRDGYLLPQVFQSIATGLVNAVNNKDYNLAQHIVVDWPAAGHGGKTWVGGRGPLGIPDTDHLLGDTFPSTEVRNAAVRNATQVGLFEQCGGACGGDGWITMHGPGGEFNVNVLTREFSVQQSDGSYFQGIAPAPGAQTVQAVSGSLPEQKPLK